MTAAHSGSSAAGDAVGSAPKLAVIGCYHETNTFAPGLTGLDLFQQEWIVGREAFLGCYAGTRTSMGGAIDASAAQGLQLAPGLYTQTTPSGTVSDAAFHRIVDSLLESVDPTADALLVILHGAMVTETIADPEGYLLQRIRERFGEELPVAVTIDLHANVSRQMVEDADLIVGYDTYPHVDVYERAVEAVELLHRLMLCAIHPVRRWKHSGQLLAPQGMQTDEGPMRRLLDLAHQLEQNPAVLNVTVAGGFPFSDVPDAGMSFIVTTDGDAELAEQFTNQLVELAWKLREDFLVRLTSPENAMRQAEHCTEGPVILVEGSDNVGGGSPADGTHLLPYLLGSRKRSLIVLCDPDAAAEAHRLGVGGTLRMAVGGKSDDWHGAPVGIEGRIRTLFDGDYRHIGRYMTGQPASMGRTAVVETGPVTLVVTEKRVAPWDPGHVRSVGLDPEDFHMIVAKSALAWKTAFGDAAKLAIDVDTPGCCAANLKQFSYRRLNRPIYPLDAIHEMEVLQ